MAQMNMTDARIANNQSTFREANEKIGAAADRMDFDDEAVPFICECADASCTNIVRLTLDEYQEVRRRPRLFFTVPGHEAIAVEAGAGVVVGQMDERVLVEKVGRAGEIAEERWEDLREEASG